jgi:hypothetical protein
MAVTKEMINALAEKHGFSVDWYSSASAERLYITKPHFTKWVDTTISLVGKEWATDMVKIGAWKQYNRTRQVAAMSRPYWKEVKPFLADVLALFGIAI